MIHFDFPQIAWLLVPWSLMLIWRIQGQRRSMRRLANLGGPRVRYVVLGRVQLSRQWTKMALFFAGSALLIVAATGPKLGTRVVELKRQGVDLLLLLDTSVSMDAADVKPSRMEKAKYEVGRLISSLEGDRIGMIVFAGSAHLHFPLTSDYAAARLFLNAVDTRLVQLQGTVLSEALRLAIDTFDPETEKYKSVVILSDGEDHDGRALEIATEAAATGIIIHTVGVGSPAGAPIQIAGGNEFKKDAAGRVVTSKLNEPMLRALARAGGGTYTRVDNRSGDLSLLADEILAMEKRTLKTQAFSQFEDRYQFFVLPALLLLIMELLLPGGFKSPPKVRSRYA
ncbi:MAG: VWA domain-containing protein [Candidatus Marinimicrobia bacterium]|nr:VWA domain-containing protein [Candidatus Neomarinimicrobiota bacterium]